MFARAPPVVNDRSWPLWKAFHNGHSKLVKAWVADRDDHIELFYLPSYSPQLNPEERLNADLKQEMDGVNQEVRSSDIHLGRLDRDECRFLAGQG